jgi:hypothetical protein
MADVSTTVTTNVLALPLIAAAISTGNNEDWVDSFKFVVDDGTGLAVDAMPQLDLRGIIFEMEVRRAVGDSEVVLAASTVSGSLFVGQPPDFGFLVINVLLAEMQNMLAGTYVADIIGRDNFNQRVAIQIDLTIFEGITIRPVNQRIEIVAP